MPSEEIKNIVHLKDFMLPALGLLFAVIGGSITAWWSNKLQKNRETDQSRYKMLCELTKELVTLQRVPYTKEDISEAGVSLYDKVSHNFEAVEKIYWQIVPLIINNNTEFAKHINSYEEIIKNRNIVNKIIQENNGVVSNDNGLVNLRDYLKSLDAFYYEIREFLANYTKSIYS